jgi:transcriptional regulator with XRE-family HTH domain
MITSCSPFGLVFFAGFMTSDKMRGMGKAGRALKQVLESYEISQTRLANEMGIGRSNIYRWVNEVRDPNSETVMHIIQALENINVKSAEKFKQLYLASNSD